MIDIRKLKELVRLMVANDLTELDLRDDQQQVTVKRGGPEAVPMVQQTAVPVAAAPAPAPAAPAAPAEPAAAPPAESELVAEPPQAARAVKQPAASSPAAAVVPPVAHLVLPTLNLGAIRERSASGLKLAASDAGEGSDSE